MGSLFDGIGGFPLAGLLAEHKMRCAWASEIDPFCVAVTKVQFGEF
jgi:DNA (cytosine-5)-methyltransferase 1